MSGKVLEFPDRRSCFRCVHYAEWASRCLLLDEEIDSEVFAARHCASYETPRRGGLDGRTV